MVNGVVSIPVIGPPLGGIPAGARSRSRNRSQRPFLVGPENRCLQAALERVIAGTKPLASPLFLYGPKNVGKSHLVHGLVASWKQFQPEQCQADTYYVTAADFARRQRYAVRSDSLVDFRNRCRSASLFAMEDVHRLASYSRVQAELIHTLDAIDKTGGFVVVTARVPPAAITTWMPQLRSRMAAGLTLAVHPPAERTRAVLVRQLAECCDVDLPAEFQSALVEDDQQDIVSLFQKALEMVQSSGLPPGKSNSFPAGPANRAGENRATMGRIATTTARYFSLPLVQIKGSGRKRTIVLARSVAIYLCRDLTAATFAQIGHFFGRRDHSTALYNYRKVRGLLTTDPEIQANVCRLRRLLTMGPLP